MSGVRIFEPTASVQTHEVDTEDVVEDGVLRKRQVIAVARSLTERMMARAPLIGYALWVDTANASHIYVAEAPSADTGAGKAFRGIRIPKDITGNPVGKVEVADPFTWDTRTTATWA